MNKIIRSLLLAASATLAILLALSNVEAQSGPYSAQIQRLLKSSNSWGGTQTFTNVTVTGTCTGCGGGLPVVDTTSIVEGSADPTKELRFEVDGFTTGTTRVATFPNADITIAGLAVAQTWTATNTYSQNLALTRGQGYLTLGADDGTGAYIYSSLVQTPDSSSIEVGNLSNSINIYERADAAFDFNNGPCGTSACTDPTLIIHSAAQNTTSWAALSYNALKFGSAATIGGGSLGTLTLDGQGGFIFANNSGGNSFLHTSYWNGITTTAPRIYIYGVAKALTAGAATGFLTLSVPASTSAGGYIQYTIEANDATDFQARSGVLGFTVVNKGGTETCTLSRLSGSTTVDNTTDNVAASVGTLTNTFTCDTSAANSITIQANAVSSLAETILRINTQAYGSGAQGVFSIP